MLHTATDATTNARRWSMIPDHAQNPKSNLQKAQKRPEMAGSYQRVFQKRGVRDFNNLARNPIGYRSTIPYKALILQRFLVEAFANGPGRITAPVVGSSRLESPSKQPASNGLRRLCCVILGHGIVLSNS
jgi:hypothetical protein